MASHYSANQYQNAFTPTKLCNWQNHTFHKEWPTTQKGFTEVIASDRGHLLPHVKHSSKNPWGDFVGTWDLPTQIPGTRAKVPTARASYAQEKLQSEYDGANTVMSGRQKNTQRLGLPQATEKSPRVETKEVQLDPESPASRSGAKHPGSKMFPEGSPVVAGQDTQKPQKVDAEVSVTPVKSPHPAKPVTDLVAM